MAHIAPAAAVLRTFARLSAGEQPQRVQLDLVKLAGLVWLGDHAAGTAALTQDTTGPSWPPPKRLRPAVDRLAAFDALHAEDRLLRLGWAFLTGPAEIDGQRRRLCLPLVSRPVRLQTTAIGRVAIHPAGDRTLLPLLADWGRAAELEAELDADGRTESWIKAVLAACGFDDVPVLGPDADPTRLIGGTELTVVMGAGLHAGEPTVSSDRGTVLHTWSRADDLDQTAFAALYRDEEHTGAAVEDPIISPLPLSPDQQAAVLAARSAPVTVIGGPPGSGKTHTLAALALDAVARGQSVLLASRTRNAADVIGATIESTGGPKPLLFGDSELRLGLSRALGDGLPVAGARTDERQDERRRALASVAQVEAAVATALQDEQMAASARAREALTPRLRALAPTAFAEGTDLVGLLALIARARTPARGPFGRSRARRAADAARRAAGAAADVALDDVELAVQAGEFAAAQLRVAAAGGTALEALRALLTAEDERSRRAVAAALDTLAVSRRRGASAAAGALSSALRSGRAARRQALAAISGPDLVAAYPLWVGTLADVEDILPPVAGMFDIVVIDESSHVDQPLAAPALVRGRRAVIAGDPRQLRHVSFVSDQAVRDAIAAGGTQALAARLNVPKVSLFDAAAATSAVHWLTEHHRCAPHLIGFAATRFYDQPIALLTTHPSIADAGCIDVERVAGARDDKGVNRAEIEAVLAHVRRRAAAGVRSIGVVTPLRQQADALEKALLEELALDEITGAGVRVGTVHGVQGSEFDEVVISLAAGSSDTAWRFVNDPNLLAVLTTRARRSVHVVCSAPEPPGLVGEYLRHADVTPGEVAGTDPDDAWTVQLAAELRNLGVPARPGYPVGQWRVDLVVGARESAAAVETRAHPDGVAAHLARWRALHGAGWRVHDAFPTRFDHDPVRAAIELAAAVADDAR